MLLRLYRRATVVSVAAAALLLVLSLPASGQTVSDVVGDVSQGQYQTYQLAVESMGLGLYGGPSYNLGIRDRNGWAGAGTLGNQETRLYLSDQFAAMGLGVTVQGGYKNVVGELTGTQTPDTVYIIGGHYDHIGNVSGASRPGGDDNASGTAGVLEAARVLSQYQFKSTIRFIGFNAEEDGMLGSKDYVNNVVLGGGQTIAGVINLDMILRPAWDNDPNAVIDVDLGTRTSNGAAVAWADLFRTTAGTYVPTLTVDSTTFNDDPGRSDHDPFALNGLPALVAVENTMSELGAANSYYHNAQDASDGLANNPIPPDVVTYDYAFATDVTRAAVALLAQEAELVPEPATMALLVLGIPALLARRRGRAR